jgi:membrane protease YdiL (CAAX protease family)
MAGFAILYVAELLVGVLYFDLAFSDLAPVILVFGLVLPVTASVLLRKSKLLFTDLRLLKNEWVLLSVLLAWIALYIIYGERFTNAVLPSQLTHNEKCRFFTIIARKLIVFVVVPFLAYRLLGFSIKDFGFKGKVGDIFSRQNLLAVVLLSLVVLAFQYFFSGGASPVRNGEIRPMQLIIALPLTVAWLFIEAGLVEEFFFRALLQSRLTVLLRSQAAAIVVSVVIFALVHVPGLYLRGSSSESIEEPMSLGFWITYCILNMSLAGIFLGIAWSRTRNIYLVMALHAIGDLLPNLKDFIHTWGI